jgi:rare lipoprotein A
MEYTVQGGDTIAKITQLMGSDWKTLKNLNPQAIGQAKANGNWFFREGAVISNEKKSNFAAILKTKQEEQQINEPQKTMESAEESSATTASKQSRHTVQAGETVWGLATRTYHVSPEAILQANNITDPTKLQIGQVLTIPESPRAKEVEENVVASWYGRYHHGRPMANGKPFDMFAATIAHKSIPLGTKVLLENPETGEKATATVTDRGPYVEGREVDLSYRLAQRLSLLEQGVGNLIMTVL